MPIALGDHGVGPAQSPPGVLRSLADYRGRDRERQEITARVGMLVFLGSWIMLFAALFFVYGSVRSRAPAWPPPDQPRLPVLLPGVNTGAMAASSAALAVAQRALQAGRHRACGAWLALAAFLGATFLSLQLAVWSGLWRAGLRPSGGTYPSAFYGLTALHALHVVVGLVALGMLAARARAGRAEQLGVDLWAWYWHAVGAVWLVLYTTVYLV